MNVRRTPYPAELPGWLLGESPQRVLDVGSGSGSFAATLGGRGHEVFCIDRSVARVAELPNRLGTRLHVVGQVESLPYLSCHFDAVTAAQTLHQFAPGLALTEIARVLKPGGRLAVVYSTRDDTVPWVKRLVALVQRADPQAMHGDYGVDSVTTVANSPYFGTLTRRNFRTWLPITRSGLIAMAERAPGIAALDTDARNALLDEVGALYDSSARAPEPLLLPYQTSAWRAEVDHTQLTLDADENAALEIRL